MSSLQSSFLRLSSLRPDGRSPSDHRFIKIAIGVQSPQTHPISSSGATNGSCYFECGNTKVYAAVSGPHDCTRRGDEIYDSGFLNVSLSVAAFGAGLDRNRMKSTLGDKKNQVLTNTIKTAFESALMLNLYPRSQIDLNIVVLADDGGRLESCINAGTLALVDAGVSMKDLVVGCCAGYVDDQAILDLTASERSTGYAGGGGAVVLPVVMLPQRNKVVLMQSDSRCNFEILEVVLKMAEEGCRNVSKIMQQAILEHCANKEKENGH